MTTSTTLVAGDTLSFPVTAPTAVDGTAYKASAGWQLVYRLVPRVVGASVITLTAVADGDDYLVQVPAATTANWAAGWYSAGAYVTLGLESYTVEPAFDQVEIKANPRTVTAGYDGRSQAVKALNDAKTALENLMATGAAATAGTVIEVRIGDRSTKYGTPEEARAALVKSINFWQAQVDNERARDRLAQGLSAGSGLQVRF